MKLSILILPFLFIFTFGCATKSQGQKVKEQMEKDDVSENAILNLTRTSYIRGCVEGIKHLTKKNSKGLYLDFCKTKAEIHESEIKEIIK